MNYNTALITGASSGIGAVFARRLALKRYNLILVARRQEKLEKLASELKRFNGINVEIILADLSRLEDIEKVEKRISELDNLEFLVNNAGFGVSGKFADNPIDRQVDMINTHVLATVRLTRAALPGMLSRNSGNIINVSSVAAFAPFSGNVTYASTKAYLVSFSKSLNTEVSSKGIKVQALCPGFTHTEFHDTEELKSFNKSDMPKILWMTSDAVVDISLKALEKSKVLVIPGLINKVLVVLFQSPIFSTVQKLAGRRRAD